MSGKPLSVGLVQQHCVQKTGKNLQTSIEGIRQAAQQGARLVLLQELHTSLYFCQTEIQRNFQLAESIPGPSSTILAQLAKELDIVIVASLFEQRAVGLYHNTAVVFEANGSIAGRYRKMHIPDDPGYHEKYYFTPGDLGFNPIDTSVGRLGILVCWDQWFPEAARLMAMAGADLLLYPTAIGWQPDDSTILKNRQLDAWITVQRAHAITNSIPVISCNRVGMEDSPHSHGKGIQFWGNSFITAADGEIHARASDQAEDVLLAQLDLSQTEQLRREWPFLRDRRIDAYGDLLKRYRDT